MSRVPPSVSLLQEGLGNLAAYLAAPVLMRLAPAFRYSLMAQTRVLLEA